MSQGDSRVTHEQVQADHWDVANAAHYAWQTTVAGIAEFLGWLAFQFGAALSNAAPGWGIVTSISEMIVGFKSAFDGTKRFIQQCMSGRGVELLGGHPSVIANALGRHSLSMLGSGIKDFSVGKP